MDIFINKVKKFIEKPKEAKAKQVIKQKGYWNSGMFFLRKDSIINNFKKHQPIIYKNCVNSIKKAKLKNNTYYLNKASFIKATAKSFDYAILEKTKKINGIKLDRKSTRLNSSHLVISYAVFCLKKKKQMIYNDDQDNQPHLYIL